MRVVAGVDIGNATTEIVLVDAAESPPRPLAWDRRPTRGPKGSRESAVAAARLLARLERSAGVSATEVVVVPQAPVRSRAVSVERPHPATGALRVLTIDCRTPAGHGYAVGHPVPVESAPDSSPAPESPRDSDPAPESPRDSDPTPEPPRPPLSPRDSTATPVVLVARDPLGFRATSAAVRRWLAAGADVRAVLLAGDEARLVAARVGADMPIVDGVPADDALAAELVAVEVAAPGGVVTRLGDPVWLSAALGTGSLDDARAIAAEVDGASAAVVAHTDSSVTSQVVRRGASGTLRDASPLGSSGQANGDASWWASVDGERRPLLDLVPTLGALPVGEVTGLEGPGEPPAPVGDLWAVDLDAGKLPTLRPGAVARRRVCLASLSADGERRTWPAELATAPDGAVRRVWSAESEVDAALSGARSTPGAGEDVTVLDLGGGTLDLVTAGGPAVTVAGCGDLLTTAVAAALDVSVGAAEWVKRSGSARVEDPHVVTDEAGHRHFLDSPAPPGTIGWLTVPGPSGRLPFSADLVPAEWRLTRRTLKRLVLADNLRRATASRPLAGIVLLAGGPAEDDELLDLLRKAHPGAVFGRADVAGSVGAAGPARTGLGTRWAVAYGLTLLHAAGRTTPADH